MTDERSRRVQSAAAAGSRVTTLEEALHVARCVVGASPAGDLLGCRLRMKLHAEVASDSEGLGPEPVMRE